MTCWSGGGGVPPGAAHPGLSLGLTLCATGQWARDHGHDLPAKDSPTPPETPEGNAGRLHAFSPSPAAQQRRRREIPVQTEVIMVPRCTMVVPPCMAGLGEQRGQRT